MDNKFLIFDFNENIHFLILFKNYIDIKDFQNKLSAYKKINQEWFYEDIEKFIKSNFDVEKYLVFENGINCNNIFDI